MWLHRIFLFKGPLFSPSGRKVSHTDHVGIVCTWSKGLSLNVSNHSYSKSHHKISLLGIITKRIALCVSFCLLIAICFSALTPGSLLRGHLWSCSKDNIWCCRLNQVWLYVGQIPYPFTLSPCSFPVCFCGIIISKWYQMNSFFLSNMRCSCYSGPVFIPVLAYYSPTLKGIKFNPPPPHTHWIFRNIESFAGPGR